MSAEGMGYLFTDHLPMRAIIAAAKAACAPVTAADWAA